MSGETGIEWTDRTWNPVVGCTKVSQGCKLCYAKTIHDMRHQAHLEGKTVAPQYAHPFETVQLMPERLTWPLSLRKPSRIFVNSVSDLFHEDVPDHFIDQVFAVMMLARRHVFQILTKRPGRMLAYMSRFDFVVASGGDGPQRSLLRTYDTLVSPHRLFHVDYPAWPLPNVQLGVSVENQPAADERIHLLLQTPAAVRFLSCEPLLGPLDLSIYLEEEGYIGDQYVRPLDWVICGGESGSSKQNPRPMHPDWARSIRDQCVANDVPFLFKQWGEYREYDVGDGQVGNEIVYTGTVHADVHAELATNPVWVDATGRVFSDPDSLPDETPCRLMERVGKKKAGRVLDGRTWDEYPEAR